MRTPLGEGKVIDVFPLRQAVLVVLPDEGRREFGKEEIQPADELEKFVKKAQTPCDKDGCNGDCNKPKK